MVQEDGFLNRTHPPNIGITFIIWVPTIQVPVSLPSTNIEFLSFYSDYSSMRDSPTSVIRDDETQYSNDSHRRRLRADTPVVLLVHTCSIVLQAPLSFQVDPHWSGAVQRPRRRFLVNFERCRLPRNWRGVVDHS